MLNVGPAYTKLLVRAKAKWSNRASAIRAQLRVSASVPATKSHSLIFNNGNQFPSPVGIVIMEPLHQDAITAPGTSRLSMTVGPPWSRPDGVQAGLG